MPTTTRDKVQRMTLNGNDPRSIALLLGISTQAVYKHLKRLRGDGLLPPQDGSGTLSGPGKG